MVFSDAERDEILKKAGAAWEHNKLSKSCKQVYLLTLRAYLSTAGLNENVCHYCLGTGKA
jgi:hypothetical protein